MSFVRLLSIAFRQNTCSRSARPNRFVPSSIQPHGHVIEFDDGSLVVRFASALVPFLFSPTAPSAGMTLDVLFPSTWLSMLRAALSIQPLSEANEGLRFEHDSVDYQGTLHRHGGLTVLELERYVPATLDGALQLARTFRRLQEAVSVSELCDITVEQTRQLTGCDRVVVYQFDEDGHGMVRSEARADDLPPYLGLPLSCLRHPGPSERALSTNLALVDSRRRLRPGGRGRNRW